MKKNTLVMLFLFLLLSSNFSYAILTPEAFRFLRRSMTGTALCSGILLYPNCISGALMGGIAGTCGPFGWLYMALAILEHRTLENLKRS